jgi:GWxTD domain-containing protein
MNRSIIFIFVFVLFSISNAQIKNSRISRYGFEINSRPTIYYNTFVSYLNGTKLLFSLNIQNDILQFKKVDDKYKAKYEISINLKDFEEEQTLLSESWNENVKIDDFSQTNSKVLYQNSRKIFNLKQDPGKYKLLVELRDAQTGNNFYSKRKIVISDQSSSKIEHSDLVILEKEDNDGEIFISPLKGLVELNTSPVVSFEYETQDADSVNISSELYKIDDEQKKIIYTNNYFLLPQHGFNSFVEKFDNSLLEEGEYLINYILSQSQNKASFQDTFKVVWFDKPTYLYKYDLALRPMMYLLSPEEYEKAEDLSIAELEIWFKKYWYEKDDTPETPFNEVQYEFYSRVQKAILDFSLRFKEGWRTERGKTLILYGEPTQIDRHHHVGKSKPFEIWYYENLNKKITFLDKNNNGDFKLVSIENIEEE